MLRRRHRKEREAGQARWGALRRWALRVVVGPAVMAGAGAGAYWAVRLGYGDLLARQTRVEAVARGIELAPGNAEHRVRLAALQDQVEEDAGAAVGALKAAVKLNPRYTTGWIELGLRAEAEGDYARAEKCLAEAARVDRMFEPRWALANYYFRRGEASQFWRWARRAAEMAYGDPGPLLRLAWKASPDAGTILERVIPERGEMLSQYLSFLLSQQQVEGARGAAERLLERGDARHVGVLLGYCDRLLEGGRVAPAVAVWNALAGRRWIGHEALAPERGVSLTNAGFAVAPLQQGFDWRIPGTWGVTVNRESGPGAVRVAFSGEQPESCECLWQLVPVVAGRKYRLSFVYRTVEIEGRSGVGWQVAEAGSGARVEAKSEELKAEEWTPGEVRFEAPSGTELVRLVLGYRRVPGTTRIEGAVVVRELKLGLER